MFKLHIECTKDITELNINFSDGTCTTIGEDDGKIAKTDDGKPTVVGSEQDDGHYVTTNNSKFPNVNKRQNLNDYLDSGEESEIIFDTTKPPIIKKRERVVSVTEESKNGQF